MRHVDRWQCDDGSVWDTPEKAEARDDLLRDVEDLYRTLGLRDVPSDDGCRFANGEGFVQQPSGSRDSLLGWLKRHANRDSDGPLGRVMYRMYCMDAEDRQWGQPYYAMNPEKAKMRQEVYT